MKTAFLYAGQGSQVEGMGYDFYNESSYAKQIYDNFVNAEKIKKLSFKSSAEELQQTENTQIVLVAFQIMVSKLLAKQGILPDAVCGLSIGEYGALYASGVLSEKSALDISLYRGKKMSECMQNLESAMYAVINMSETEINEILSKYNSAEKFVQISNFNTETQIVISGEKSVAEKVVDEIKTRGKKALKLKVSGAFHTDYMDKATKQLKTYFEDVKFNAPQIHVYYNYTGTSCFDTDIAHTMIMQVKSPVRFSQNIQTMLADGIENFIEIGCNQTLKKMLKKIDTNINMSSIGTFEDFQALLK